MASTATAANLTEVHRLAQARLGAQTVQAMFAAWNVLDVADLDGTVARWLRVAVPLVRAQRTTSSTLARHYYQTFRAMELPGARPFTVPPSRVLVTDRTVTSLTVTGPAHVRTATGSGLPLSRASELGMTSSAGAGMRLALEGGRETVLAAAQADSRARGWVRVTSGAPCEFCENLAGVEFGSETSASFQSHDSCACAAEPLIN